MSKNRNRVKRIRSGMDKGLGFWVFKKIRKILTPDGMERALSSKIITRWNRH